MVGFPFAGVVDQRPYPATGLTTARWAAEVPAANIQFADLWLTQPGVNILALFGRSDRISDQFPHVVAWQDRLWLEDGHNRIVRAALCLRATAATVRLYRIA